MGDTMVTLAVGWQKSWSKAAQCYILEIDDSEMWMGRVGKGGAFWDVPKLQPHVDRRWSLEGQAISRTGGALGRAVGDKILAKFQAEVAANIEAYNDRGRDALAEEKQTRAVTRSDIGNPRLIDAVGGNTPAALRGLEPPFLTCEIDGKTHIFFALEASDHTMDEVKARLES